MRGQTDRRYEASDQILGRLNRRLAAVEARLSRFVVQDAGVDFTPGLTATTTDPTLGSGSSATGTYWLSNGGRLVHCRFRIAFGTSGVSAGSGIYIVTFPFTIEDAASGIPIGSARISDFSVSTNNRAGVILSNGRLIVGDNSANVTAIAPFTFAASDVISGSFTAEVV